MLAPPPPSPAAARLGRGSRSQVGALLLLRAPGAVVVEDCALDLPPLADVVALVRLPHLRLGRPWLLVRAAVESLWKKAALYNVQSSIVLMIRILLCEKATGVREGKPGLQGV